MSPFSTELREVFASAGLLPLAERLLAGGRLTDAEAVQLFDCPHVLAVGLLADRVRVERHGDVSWFNRNLHINATNVCEATCIFCSFSRLKTGDPAAYTMRREEALGRIRALADAFITEVHIVNGLNPDLPFAYYEDLLRAIKEERPDLHIKGFTAVEIHYYAQKYDMEPEEVLRRLREAGLDSMPGGGAEIFAERTRHKLCPDKVDSEGWLAIHRLAHRMGFRTNATMLFGAIESVEDRVDHLRRLRELQDETGGFQTFIPLRFHNENNRLRNVAATPDADCWLTLAVARLYLDNFPHIKAYWPMLGLQVAQLAQLFGASDIDGTVREERIYHMAGARTPQGLTREELIRLIERADRLPLERDTLYRIVAPTPPLFDASGPAAPARIGIVGYLNAWPLTAFLDRERHRVVEGVPSAIAASLARGEVDVALVPVAALFDGSPWRVLSGVAIGADGPVESVFLVAETAPERWTEVLLDGESRTSAVLARLLLTRGPLAGQVREGLRFRQVEPGTALERAAGGSAALVIGDRARQIPRRFGVRLDLAELWKRWTGLPFVFAVWAGRPDVDPRLTAELTEVARRGLQAIPERFEGVDRAYLEGALRYALDDRALMGLRRFAALGHEAGLFAHPHVELLGPEERRVRRASPWVPLGEWVARAAARHRPPAVVRWGLEGEHPLAYRRWAPAQSDALRRLGTVQRITFLDALSRAEEPLDRLLSAGLTHVSLDDGGPLLTDPARRASAERAVRAGLVLEGCIRFGPGDDEAALREHVAVLEALGAVANRVRVTGWRGPGSEGQGTAADWLRAVCRVRCWSDLELVVPWRTEGLGVLAVGLQAAADGIEPLPVHPGWEQEAWALERALRHAGFEPERIGMETPRDVFRRVVRRPDRRRPRADLR